MRISDWSSDVCSSDLLADIADSAIAPAIVESCPQRIFLPNDRAIEPQARSAYARFGLNERQVELLARATPQRHYSLQSRRGNRLFQLGPGPIAPALRGPPHPAPQPPHHPVLPQPGTQSSPPRLLP